MANFITWKKPKTTMCAQCYRRKKCHKVLGDPQAQYVCEECARGRYGDAEVDNLIHQGWLSWKAKTPKKLPNVAGYLQLQLEERGTKQEQVKPQYL